MTPLKTAGAVGEGRQGDADLPAPPVGPPPCLSTPTLCEQQQRAYGGPMTPSVIALSLVKNHKLGVYNIVPFNISKPGFHILSVYIFYMMKINNYVIIIKFTSG